jgi:hypothetical protein
MLLMSGEQRQILLREEYLSPGSPLPSPRPRPDQINQRRLSIVSSLRVQLESTSILDLDISTTKILSPRATVPIDQQRSFSPLDALSRVEG